MLNVPHHARQDNILGEMNSTYKVLVQ